MCLHLFERRKKHQQYINYKVIVNATQIASNRKGRCTQMSEQELLLLVERIKGNSWGNHKFVIEEQQKP